MDIEKTEKMLEQSANDVKMRDFSEVWQDIKGEIEVPQKAHKKAWGKRYLPTILAACFMLIFAIALPIYLLNPHIPSEEVYFRDNLSMVEVDETTFFTQLSNAKVTHVSFSNYIAKDCALYQTEDSKTKGGFVTLYDNASLPTKIVKMKFYDKSVQVDDFDKEYGNSYSKEGLTVSYNVKDSYPEYNIYIYDIKASFNNVNYLIEYTSNESNPETFFESFFK